MQQYLDLDEHEIVKPGDTRWLSLKKCLDRIIEQWPALLLHFEASLFHKECTKSRRILSLMKDPFMFILIEFLAEGKISYWFNFIHLV